MFIPLKMVLIGIDPYPDLHLGGTQSSTFWDFEVHSVNSVDPILRYPKSPHSKGSTMWGPPVMFVGL